MKYDPDLLNLKERRSTSLTDKEVERLINTIQFARNWARRVRDDEIVDVKELLNILGGPIEDQLAQGERDALLDILKDSEPFSTIGQFYARGLIGNDHIEIYAKDSTGQDRLLTELPVTLYEYTVEEGDQ